MPSITFQRTFRCTPERLFAYLEEPEKIVQWMKGVLEDRPTSPGPTGVGSTFLMRIQEGRKVREYQGRVTAYDKPRRMAIVMWGGCFPEGSEMACDYRLEAVPEGTRVDYACGFEPQGFFMRLMSPLFLVMGKMQVKSFFKKLAELVEAPEGAPEGARARTAH
jgi:hypothetical protein